MTLVTVAVAAERLGITKEAVRKRMSRGTLDAEKSPDGTVRVYVPSSPTVGDTDRTQSASDALTSELRDRLRYVEGQLEAERQAHAEARRLLMAALERIPPQLEAPPDERESPETDAEPRPSSPGPPEAETPARPWWRRIFST